MGKHINGQLDYLAKLLRAWRHHKRNKQLETWNGCAVVEAFDWKRTTLVKVNLPMYETPQGALILPSAPVHVSAPVDVTERRQLAQYHLQHVVNALNTLRKNCSSRENRPIADDASMLNTFETLAAAHQEYLHESAAAHR